MTAPATYQTGGQMPRRPRAPGAPSSPMGDGAPQANGLQQMPSGAGTTPQRQWQTNRPPAPQGGAGQPPAPPPTFAQMQANGQARPAPPPQPQQTIQTMQAPAQPPGASSFQGASQSPSSGVSGSLNSAVQQALANPSAYGSQQVQDVYKMLTQNLGQDYDYQRQQLGEEMARRGLSDSTIAGQHYSDLATEQARAQANIATQLAQQAALTYGQDRNSAIQAGLGLGNLDLSQQLGLGNLGVAQQNANTSAQSAANQYALGQGSLGLQGEQIANDYALGQGQLGVSQQAQDLARQLGLGNLNLNQQQLAQQGSQFQQQLGENSRQFNAQQSLAQMLGLGNLGVSQQQANTQSAAQQAEAAYQQGQLGISQQGQDLAKLLGLGNLGVSQGQLDLSRQLGLGNLGLQQQQLNQQGSQFQQSLALDQLKNQQQFGLQQADLTGNYNGQSTLASRAQQMAQQQFAQQLAQQLGIATMQDKTANRGIDVQGANNNNQLMMQLAMLGITGGLANSVAGIASGATGGTGTAGAGGTGGAASSSLSPGAQSFLNDPANQQKDPRLYATLALSNNDPNMQAFLNDPTKSINFGGQQYSGKEYLQLMQQHPELFGVNTAANQNAAYNADWFKNSTMQSATPLPSDAAQQSDPNAPFAPQGNDYGFAKAGGHTLADWQAYQTSPAYQMAKWATDHPGQSYNGSSGAAFNPGDGRSVAQYINDAGYGGQNVQVGNDGSIMDATTGKTLKGPATSTNPADTDAYERQRLIDLAARLGVSPADVGLTNYDY